MDPTAIHGVSVCGHCGAEVFADSHSCSTTTYVTKPHACPGCGAPTTGGAGTDLCIHCEHFLEDRT